MVLVQSLKNKKGEVDFRKKLAKQFLGKEIVFPGEPNASEFSTITKDRIKDYTKYFNYLIGKNIYFSPYLEIGAGVGQGALLLENTYDANGFTTDISLETLRLTTKYQKELKYKKMPIRIVCDTYNLPFRSGSIPFIFTFQTLHHLPDPKPVLEEVKRVLAPGGYFYFNEEPIAQTFNLNLWRRDRHLRWFEKLLKATIILHFISRIGKAETDNDILEETFTLSTWEKALAIFKEVKATLIVFPFGFKITRKKNKKSGWIKPLFPHKILLNILGGGIEAICKKEGRFTPTRLTNILEVLACPNCKSKPKLLFKKEDKSLRCNICKSIYKQNNSIYLLLSNEQKKVLYP